MDIDQRTKQLKSKSTILSNLFNEKYGLKLGEFQNTTGTERVNSFFKKTYIVYLICITLVVFDRGKTRMST